MKLTYYHHHPDLGSVSIPSVTSQYPPPLVPPPDLSHFRSDMEPSSVVKSWTLQFLLISGWGTSIRWWCDFTNHVVRSRKLFFHLLPVQTSQRLLCSLPPTKLLRTVHPHSLWENVVVHQKTLLKLTNEGTRKKTSKVYNGQVESIKTSYLLNSRFKRKPIEIIDEIREIRVFARQIESFWKSIW